MVPGPLLGERETDEPTGWSAKAPRPVRDATPSPSEGHSREPQERRGGAGLPLALAPNGSAKRREGRS